MRGFRTSWWCSVALAACLSLAACGSGDDTSAPAGSGDGAAAPTGGGAGSGSGSASTAAADVAALQKRGKVIYETYCTACHARNPVQDGPVGPANAGASLELLEAKVLRNEYPAGYTPKRETAAMVPLTHLEPELPALHAFLNSFEE